MIVNATMPSALLFFLLLLLLPPPPAAAAAASLQSTPGLFRTHFIPSPDAAPTTFFEVTKPILLPNTTPCSYLLLRHDFAFTYGQPPVLSPYTPPSDCPSQSFSKIVLEWSASCRGRQFDRIFGVWLGGVELLRSCTAEPTAAGIVWTVKKDVTRYHSLLMHNQTLAVYLGNVVNQIYTGVYHVNVSLHFYPDEVLTESWENLRFPIGADLILPISRKLPLNDGLWFEIKNSTQIVSKEFEIPQNSYKAVLEVYVSFHENDEFWYSNLPNEYTDANNLPKGNGPFREVIVQLDDLVVGAIWPFTVIYTGGINPLFWRPVTGVGSFDLPSYDIEITPLLGKVLDGKTHRLAFSVTNALNVWYIDANLHVWLDKKSVTAYGKLLEHTSLPLSLSILSNFTGRNGSFISNGRRLIESVGWVKSSEGKITTQSCQKFLYTNNMVMANDGNLQVLNHVIDLNASVEAKTPSSPIRLAKSQKKFTLDLHTEDTDKGDGTYISIANVSLGIDEKWKRVSESGVSTGKLKNTQDADGYMLVRGQLVVSGLGSMRQEYGYTGDMTCYYRKVRASNYSIVHDEVSNACKERKGGNYYIGVL